MQRALCGGLLIGLLVVCPASAALIIDVGNTDVFADSTGQVVTIHATGIAGGDPQVSGINVNARIGDGLGGIGEPVFQAIDFSGGIWDAFPYTLVDDKPVEGAEQYVQASLLFDVTGQKVDADGLIATLVIDTNGYSPGSVFELRLGDTGVGDTDYIGHAAVITNGTITLNAVPEPAVMVQLFGLMAAMGPWFWLRKRNR